MKKARMIDNSMGVKVQEVVSPFAYGEAKRKFFASKEEARAYFDKFSSLSEEEREQHFEEMSDDTDA